MKLCGRDCEPEISTRVRICSQQCAFSYLILSSKYNVKTNVIGNSTAKESGTEKSVPYLKSHSFKGRLRVQSQAF